MKKDLLSIKDLSKDELSEIFDLAAEMKKSPFAHGHILGHKVVGLIFQKPSNRTRVSFQVGTIHLGGQPLYFGPGDIDLGEREPIRDAARVLSGYLQLAVLRTFRHADIAEFAGYARIPVINGLSELFHPCQGITDIFTIKERLGAVSGKTLCFIGDGNNVLHSLLYCGVMCSMNIKIATPKKYGPNRGILKDVMLLSKTTGSKVTLGNDPKEAIKGADVLYTDVWVSMGEESRKRTKMNAFKGFQINKKILGMTGKDVPVMHCLPAHRGEEITDDVMEGKQSIVFQQAENRLHVAKAIMAKLS